MIRYTRKQAAILFKAGHKVYINKEYLMNNFIPFDTEADKIKYSKKLKTATYWI